jgi:predicted acetyltransferase/8-oxo-dGTP pyrophosphatase MutT (NUDIX family)/RimJ/RimL family protein N-acetyltransferase
VKLVDIIFEKVSKEHKLAIFSWLAEPHVQEFWDNTQDHKDDILNFMEGRKTSSFYCGGKYVYFVAKKENHPFALIMTIKESAAEDIGELKLASLSKLGTSYGIDYMIGDKDYFGKGYGAATLSSFVEFFKSEIDSKADAFLIDPSVDNPRAKHVYMKAGFEYVGDFVMAGEVSGKGKLHHLLVKKFEPNIDLVAASIEDLSLIQNMSMFYVYDLSRDCSCISDEWSISENGLYEPPCFKRYFEEDSRKVFLIKVNCEVAGFVLLNQVGTSKKTDWNLGEFFVLAKFQKLGIGKKVAEEIWNLHPGNWEVLVLPENKSALKFWNQTIKDYTNGDFIKEVKEIDYDKDQSKRFVFTFNSKKKPSLHNSVRILLINDDDELLLMCADDPTTTSKEGVYHGKFWFCIGGEIEKDESLMEAAVRELKEETGLSCEDVVFGPKVWFGEFDLVLSGKLRRLQQKFIVARTSKKNVNMKNLTTNEKKVVESIKWFSLDNIINCNEVIYPVGLEEYLIDILDKKYPADPIWIDLDVKPKVNF